jgi:hypothetical protein
VQTPERFPPPRRRLLPPARPTGLWAVSDALAWASSLVLMLSSFMGWYAGKSLEGPTLAVIGWHTGTIGKLVFFIGFALLALMALREAGIEPPPSVPESLLIVALGSLAAVLVLIRIISIPDTFFAQSDRGIGIWIALLASLGVIVSGLLHASEELS